MGGPHKETPGYQIGDLGIYKVDYRDAEDVQYRQVGDLKNTDKVMNDTFWLGVYPGLTSEMVEYMIERIRQIVSRGW